MKIFFTYLTEKKTPWLDPFGLWCLLPLRWQCPSMESKASWRRFLSNFLIFWCHLEQKYFSMIRILPNYQISVYFFVTTIWYIKNTQNSEFEIGNLENFMWWANNHTRRFITIQQKWTFLGEQKVITLHWSNNSWV